MLCIIAANPNSSALSLLGHLSGENIWRGTEKISLWHEAELMEHPTAAQCGSPSNSFSIQVLVKIIFTFASPTREIVSLSSPFCSPSSRRGALNGLKTLRNFVSFYMLAAFVVGASFKALIETFSRLIKSEANKTRKGSSRRPAPRPEWEENPS